MPHTNASAAKLRKDISVDSGPICDTAHDNNYGQTTWTHQIPNCTQIENPQPHACAQRMSSDPFGTSYPFPQPPRGIFSVKISTCIKPHTNAAGKRRVCKVHTQSQRDANRQGPSRRSKRGCRSLDDISTTARHVSKVYYPTCRHRLLPNKGHKATHTIRFRANLNIAGPRPYDPPSRGVLLLVFSTIKVRIGLF